MTGQQPSPAINSGAAPARREPRAKLPFQFAFPLFEQPLSACIGAGRVGQPDQALPLVYHSFLHQVGQRFGHRLAEGHDQALAGFLQFTGQVSVEEPR